MHAMQIAMMTESDHVQDPVRPATPDQAWLADYAARGYGVLRGLPSGPQATGELTGQVRPG